MSELFRPKVTATQVLKEIKDNKDAMAFIRHMREQQLQRDLLNLSQEIGLRNRLNATR